MALVLGVCVGDEIYAGDDMIVIDELYEDGSLDLTVLGQSFHINDERGIEIIPDVLVSTGVIQWNIKQARLVFKAPRRITILRSEMYLAGKANAGIPAHS